MPGPSEQAFTWRARLQDELTVGLQNLQTSASDAWTTISKSFGEGASAANIAERVIQVSMASTQEALREYATQAALSGSQVQLSLLATMTELLTTITAFRTAGLPTESLNAFVEAFFAARTGAADLSARLARLASEGPEQLDRLAVAAWSVFGEQLPKQLRVALGEKLPTLQTPPASLVDAISGLREAVTNLPSQMLVATQSLSGAATQFQETITKLPGVLKTETLFDRDTIIDILRRVFVAAQTGASLRELIAAVLVGLKREAYEFGTTIGQGAGDVMRPAAESVLDRIRRVTGLERAAGERGAAGEREEVRAAFAKPPEVLPAGAGFAGYLEGVTEATTRFSASAAEVIGTLSQGEMIAARFTLSDPVRMMGDALVKVGGFGDVLSGLAGQATGAAAGLAGTEGMLGSLVTAFPGIVAGIGGVVATVTTALTAAFSSLLPLTLLARAVSTLVGPIVSMAGELFDTLIEPLAVIGEILSTLLVPVFDMLAAVLYPVFDALIGIIEPLVAINTAIAEALQPIFDVLGSLIRMVLMPFVIVARLLEVALKPFIFLLNWLMLPMRILGVWMEKLMDAVESLFEPFSILMNAIFEPLMSILDMVVGGFEVLMDLALAPLYTLIGWISDLIQYLTEPLRSFAEMVQGFFSFEWLTDLLPGWLKKILGIGGGGGAEAVAEEALPAPAVSETAIAEALPAPAVSETAIAEALPAPAVPETVAEMKIPSIPRPFLPTFPALLTVDQITKGVKEGVQDSTKSVIQAIRDTILEPDDWIEAPSPLVAKLASFEEA